MQTQKNETYNGYTNFETWLMSLNLDNDQCLNEELHKFANALRLNIYERSEALKEWVAELFYNEEFQVYKICDTWTERDFQEIDFYDIVESHIEED